MAKSVDEFLDEVLNQNEKEALKYFNNTLKPRVRKMNISAEGKRNLANVLLHHCFNHYRHELNTDVDFVAQTEEIFKIYN